MNINNLKVMFHVIGGPIEIDERCKLLYIENSHFGDIMETGDTVVLLNRSGLNKVNYCGKCVVVNVYSLPKDLYQVTLGNCGPKFYDMIMRKKSKYSTVIAFSELLLRGHLDCSIPNSLLRMTMSCSNTKIVDLFSKGFEDFLVYIKKHSKYYNDFRREQHVAREIYSSVHNIKKDVFLPANV